MICLCSIYCHSKTIKYGLHLEVYYLIGSWDGENQTRDPWDPSNSKSPLYLLSYRVSVYRSVMASIKCPQSVISFQNKYIIRESKAIMALHCKNDKLKKRKIVRYLLGLHFWHCKLRWVGVIGNKIWGVWHRGVKDKAVAILSTWRQGQRRESRIYSRWSYNHSTVSSYRIFLIS